MTVKKPQLKILITAGGTREYIDPVRFLSNASSGRMGYALARAAIRAGRKVTLITAPTALKPPAQAKVIPVVSSEDMFKAVRAEFARCGCLIMAAAVSDYTPVKKEKGKIKKGKGIFTLRLKPTQDILAWAGRHKRKGQILVGFALEDKNLKKNAERKLNDKNLDLIVANSPAAIAADKSTVYIKTKDTPWQILKNISKLRAAAQIIKTIDAL
jgi:phosphopantothenoylcysteine decarboxylase/phosphopantothenate--cysteine ligase